MSTSVEQAIDYVQRGWKVIPVPPRKKAPIVKNWPKLSLTKEEIPSYFEANSNIGVLLGERSGGLVDIDIDATEGCKHTMVKEIVKELQERMRGRGDTGNIRVICHLSF